MLPLAALYPAALTPTPALPPQVPFISGIEVFERGHRTTPHVHPHAHELFFILAGEGVGFCGNHRFPGKALRLARHGMQDSMVKGG